jgi:hypothetical protein
MIETYEGHEVIGSRMKLVNAGDGLSEAMRIAPMALHVGDRVVMIVEAVVTKIEHSPAEPKDWTGPFLRTHTLRAEAATVTDNATTLRIIDKHKAAVLRAREIDGQRSIDDEMEGDEWDESN